jgi:hypothetical protein
MMMKFFLLLVFLTVIGKAQDTLTYSTLTTEQYLSWEKTEKEWKNEHYYAFLKKNNIKLNCTNCNSVYLWLVFKCDSVKTTSVILKNKKCATEFTKTQLFELKKMVEFLVLPHEFINTVFKVYIGSALKC